MAYSDKEKNTSVVRAPAFTIIGESTPSTFFENINEKMIADGLLPRFTIIEYDGPIVPENEDHYLVEPPIGLIQSLADIIPACISNSTMGKISDIGITPDAKTILRNFGEHLRKTMNAEKKNRISRHLWSRAKVRVFKLAGLIAVGVNWIDPVITADIVNGTIDAVYAQITKLQARFDNDEVGGGSVDDSASEEKQLKLIVRVISNFACLPFASCAEKYRVRKDMYEARIFPYSSLFARLASQVVFKADKRGAAEAIRRTYQQLIDNDDIREVAKADMQKKFGKSARAFMITHSERFLEVVE
jgi:hypothetical protein